MDEISKVGMSVDEREMSNNLQNLLKKEKDMDANR